MSYIQFTSDAELLINNLTRKNLGENSGKIRKLFLHWTSFFSTTSVASEKEE